MKKLLAAVVLVCAGAPAYGVAQTPATALEAADTSLQQKILALEKRRIAAMVNKDMATLDSILADDLTYTHSGGRTDTKAAFMALIKGPDNRYLGVDYTNTEVITTGSAVIVRGVAQIRLGEGPRGPATSYPVLFLDVYALRNGVWRMVAWQATRPGE